MRPICLELPADIADGRPVMTAIAFVTTYDGR